MRPVEKVVVYALRLAALGVLVGAWAYATGPGHVSKVLLPSLSSFGSAVSATVRSGAVWSDVGYTVVELALSVVISCVGGVIVGFWTARGRFRRQVLETMYAWGYMTPFVLFYPLFLLIFGIGTTSKVAYAACGAFFPVAYIGTRAFGDVSSVYLRAGRAFGASRWQIDWSIKLRAALPVLKSGLRIGVASCVIYVIFGEMLGASRGVGFRLGEASATLDVPVAYALTALIIVLAAVLQAATNRLLPGGEDEGRVRY